MKFIQILATKPWLDNSDQKSLHNESISEEPSNEKTALLFLLAIISVVFFLFTITFLQRSQSFDFQALAGEPWLPFSNSQQLWINSSYLLLASIFITLTAYFSKHDRLIALTLCLISTILFTALFITGQLKVWQFLQQSGFAINTNPANSYYFLLTGIHALHICAGIIVLLKVIGNFSFHKENKQLTASLKLCSLYWHYLLLLWLFLFLLLSASTDTYKTIALLCGF